jgi:nucleoside-diphosphate-sugar epimerase
VPSGRPHNADPGGRFVCMALDEVADCSIAGAPSNPPNPSRDMTGCRDQSIPRILIVGASGFVGAAIVRAAMVSNDMRPVACMRGASRALDSIGVETRLCDASDPIALARALEGVTYAVNCVLGNRATMLAVTRNLCAAARQLGLRRIVHLSSMAVYGRMTGTVDETVRLQPVGGYGLAKAECEIIVGDFIAAGGDAVMLRPACVYGPGGERWVGRIARWLRAGRLGQLGELAGGYCNLSFNDDLAGAAIAALRTREAAGETFNIADPDPGTWDQYFLRLGREVGAPLRRVSRHQMLLETALLAAPLQIAKIVGQRFGLPPGALPEPITPSLLPLWRQRVRLNCQKADDALSLRHTPLQRGLALSADWFRSAALK